MTPADVADPGPMGLVGGLFENVRDLMGDKAGSAVFRFAAVQEGQRIGGSYGRGQLAEALARIDGMLDQHTDVQSEESGKVTVRVRAVHGWTENAVVDGVRLGLLEGVMQAVRGRRYKAEISGKDDAGMTVVLEVDDA